MKNPICTVENNDNFDNSFSKKNPNRLTLSYEIHWFGQQLR